MKYYLAYGSNLSTKQMGRRCPSSKLVGTTILNDYKLEFKTAFGGGSFATISKAKGVHVPVGIYALSEKDEKTLDIYEGVDGGHYFKDELEVKFKKKKYKCMVYIMNLKAVPSIPSFTYVDVILEGYIEHGFDTNILDNAVIESAK